MKLTLRSPLTAVLLAACSSLLAPSHLLSVASAQNSAAQANADHAAPALFTGEFDNQGVRVSLEQSGQNVTGTLHLGDTQCPITGTVADGVLSGQVVQDGATEHFTAKFENGKLLITEGETTLSFDRINTDKPTLVAHPKGLDFTLPIGWSKREVQGKLQFMTPKGLLSVNTTIIAEVQDWSPTQPITDPVALSSFRTDLQHSLPTFSEVGNPSTIALGKNAGVLLHLKGNTDEVASIHINVYIRSVGPKIAFIMVIGDEADLTSADQPCRAIMSDVVPHGQVADASPSLAVTCPDAWKMEQTKAGFTLFPPAKADGTAPGDFTGITQQPWTEPSPFFEVMTTQRVDDEIAIAFPKAKRVGDLERLGPAETDGVRALYQTLFTEGDDRMVDIRIKKLGDTMVIAMWMGGKSLQETRLPVVASVFKGITLAAPPAEKDSSSPSTSPPNQSK